VRLQVEEREVRVLRGHGLDLVQGWPADPARAEGRRREYEHERLVLGDRLVLRELVEARIRAGIGGDLLRVAAGIGELGGLHSGYVVAQARHDAAILDLES